MIMSQDIPLTLIDTDPGQPRQHFDPASLDELAQSIRQNGLIQPVLLRPVGGRFVIVHGERRYRAACLLGMQTIAADVREMTEGEARLIALIENVQRADLSPIEEARAYDAHLAGGITQAALGERIGKSQSYIAGKLRLLRMPLCLQLLLDRGALTEGHIKQLLRLESFYDGELTDVWQEAIVWEELESDPGAYVQAFVWSGRPLESWSYFVNWNDDDRLALDALRTLYEEVKDLGHWPVWNIPALWFGLSVYYWRHSVAELKDIIDLFMTYVVNAAAYLQWHNKPSQATDYETVHYFGALADLRHAGLSSWADKDGAGRKLYRDGSPLLNRRHFDFQSYVLPTVMQREIKDNPDGAVARQYARLEAMR